MTRLQKIKVKKVFYKIMKVYFIIIITATIIAGFYLSTKQRELAPLIISAFAILQGALFIPAFKESKASDVNANLWVTSIMSMFATIIFWGIFL